MSSLGFIYLAKTRANSQRILSQGIVFSVIEPSYKTFDFYLSDAWRNNSFSLWFSFFFIIRLLFIVQRTEKRHAGAF